VRGVRIRQEKKAGNRCCHYHASNGFWRDVDILVRTDIHQSLPAYPSSSSISSRVSDFITASSVVIKSLTS
jgi:hypothetical protein